MYCTCICTCKNGHIYIHVRVCACTFNIQVLMYIHTCIYMYMYMINETTTKQHNITPETTLFQRKMSCFRWDSLLSSRLVCVCVCACVCVLTEWFADSIFCQCIAIHTETLITSWIVTAELTAPVSLITLIYIWRERGWERGREGEREGGRGGREVGREGG